MESLTDIKEKRAQLINKLLELMELYNGRLLQENINCDDSIKEDYLRANLVETLKLKNHPIIKDLEEVGLIDYYNSVIHFIKMKSM
jgi:hypothetical protein